MRNNCSFGRVDEWNLVSHNHSTSYQITQPRIVNTLNYLINAQPRLLMSEFLPPSLACRGETFYEGILIYSILCIHQMNETITILSLPAFQEKIKRKLSDVRPTS